MSSSSERTRPAPIPISHPSEARANVSYVLEKPAPAVKPSRKENADG